MSIIFSQYKDSNLTFNECKEETTDVDTIQSFLRNLGRQFRNNCMYGWMSAFQLVVFHSNAFLFCSVVVLIRVRSQAGVDMFSSYGDEDHFLFLPLRIMGNFMFCLPSFLGFSR